MPVTVNLHKLVNMSAEMSAAKSLKALLENELSSIDGQIWLLPNVIIPLEERCCGIDLLVIGYLDGYTVDKVADKKDVQLCSFCTTVEIKCHPISQISMNGSHLFVSYPSEEKLLDVTNQSYQQKESLSRYLMNALNTTRVTFVSSLIWLMGTDKHDYTSIGGEVQNSNVLVRDSSSEDFFRTIACQTKFLDDGVVDAFSSQSRIEDIELVVNRLVELVDHN